MYNMLTSMTNSLVGDHQVAVVDVDGVLKVESLDFFKKYKISNPRQDIL